MRLIDADALKINIYHNRKEVLNDELVQCIDNTPTAYDMENVVKQLEVLREQERNRPDSCDEDGCGDGEQIYDDGRSQGRFEAFGKAIEIVKGGVADA